MPTSTEEHLLLEIFRAVATRHHRDPPHVGVKLSAHLLRFLEMPFVGSNLYYHKDLCVVEGATVETWQRGLEQFAGHFGGEGLIVDSSGKLCTNGEVQHTYLR
ncbi:hypothetical protein P3T76_004816 [Phytophthora citrophthora]|uniref:Uncharacterized protein n=1 Tax=Phytophthora citrophthora TaxID=4793 RepID=A0AAD9GRK5_9STRA|nr:hypothetical protein P3T76_004816 [Phytophthora citrophthora]